MVALIHADYGYIIENGHVVLKGEAENMLHREDVKELYMGTTEGADCINFKEVKYYHRRRPAFI